MKYTEFKKWKTEELRNVPCLLYRLDGKVQDVGMPRPVYKSELGTLMEVFIKHQAIPWWKRAWDHKSVTDMFIRIFNQISVEWMD